MSKKTIIFVCGLSTPSWALKKWKFNLAKTFKEYEIHFVGDCQYGFEDIKTMKKLIVEISTLIKQSHSCILIGHSMGGILIGSLYQKVLLLDTIEKIITINSPHSMIIKNPKTFSINDVKKQLHYNPSFDMFQKVLTVGSYFDTTVPKKYAHTKYSRKINLLMGHYLLFYISTFHIRKIINNIKIF